MSSSAEPDATAAVTAFTSTRSQLLNQDPELVDCLQDQDQIVPSERAVDGWGLAARAWSANSAW